MSETSMVELKPHESQFLREFIELYQAQPCLWRYASKDYRNREVKERAYRALVDKMREVEPRANKNSVLRKINSLRTAFRREFKKVRRMQAGLQGGKSLRRKYVPSLWYYELLKFVIDQQGPDHAALDSDWTVELPAEPYAVDEHRNAHDNADSFMDFLEDSQIPPPEVKLEPSSPALSRAGSPNLGLEINAVYSEKSSRREEEMPILRTRKQQQLQMQQQQLQNQPPPQHQPQNQQSPQQPPNQQSSEQQSPQQQPQPQQPLHQQQLLEPDLERFGAYVVSKLRRSQCKQIIIAEKVIAEVLMRANLGTLDETTMLTDIKVPPSLL